MSQHLSNEQIVTTSWFTSDTKFKDLEGTLP